MMMMLSHEKGTLQVFVAIEGHELSHLNNFKYLNH